MKTRIRLLVLAVALVALPIVLQAQPSAHYAPGVEGIKAATLPPPGVYLRDYNYIYWSSQLNNLSGHEISGTDLDAFTYVNLPRLVWITDVKVLDGYLGVDGFLPLVYQKVDVNTPGGPFNGNNFGPGDLFVEGTVSWHLKQFDISIGSGVDLPTGASPSRFGPTTMPGLGYWTFMQTVGATWYIDEEKTWSVSALNRYEFNTEQRETHVTYGDAYTLEWGVGKSVCKAADVGIAGYYQRQVTGNENQPPGTSQGHNSVAAVGPEVTMAFPEIMLFTSLRYNYEFMAKGRAQGSSICLTLTKRF